MSISETGCSLELSIMKMTGFHRVSEKGPETDSAQASALANHKKTFAIQKQNNFLREDVSF